MSCFEIDQVASDSTRATTSVTSESKPVEEQKEKTPLDFVLSVEIDEQLNRDMLKVYLPTGSNLTGSISEVARQVSPLNLVYTG